MLLLDTPAQQRLEQGQRLSEAKALRQRTLERDIQSNTISVSDDAGRDVSNLMAQMGRPLTGQQVIERLKRCNSKLIFERSKAFPELTGIYVMKWIRNAAGGWEEQKVHVCGMESGVMPEFSVLHKRKKKVANPDLFGQSKPTREIDWLEIDTFAGETRGWRTLLIRLMKAELVSRGDVERYFDWTPTRQSEKWHSQINRGA